MTSGLPIACLARYMRHLSLRIGLTLSPQRVRYGSLAELQTGTRPGIIVMSAIGQKQTSIAALRCTGLAASSSVTPCVDKREYQASAHLVSARLKASPSVGRRVVRNDDNEPAGLIVNHGYQRPVWSSGKKDTRLVTCQAYGGNADG